jgi:hypothetical protein
MITCGKDELDFDRFLDAIKFAEEVGVAGSMTLGLKPATHLGAVKSIVYY